MKTPQGRCCLTDSEGSNVRVWLCELNAERKRLQRSESTLRDYQVLDGFDISAESFLPENQRPSKIVLRTQDAKENPPADMQEKYDVVHVRLVVAVVSDGDPSRIVKHCYDLLRM